MLLDTFVYLRIPDCDYAVKYYSYVNSAVSRGRVLSFRFYTELKGGCHRNILLSKSPHSPVVRSSLLLRFSWSQSQVRVELSRPREGFATRNRQPWWKIIDLTPTSTYLLWACFASFPRVPCGPQWKSLQFPMSCLLFWEMGMAVTASTLWVTVVRRD